MFFIRTEMEGLVNLDSLSQIRKPEPALKDDVGNYVILGLGPRHHYGLILFKGTEQECNRVYENFVELVCRYEAR
jgi:hypothetical protein